MKNVRNYIAISLLALVAFVMIAARSAESTGSQPNTQGIAAPVVEGSAADMATMTAPTSAEAAVATPAEDPAAAPTKAEHKLSLKEKIAAKIVAKQVKKELREAEAGKTTAGKSQLVALLLCIFFGVLGVHRFYLGYIGIGLLELFTGGLCGILTLIDFIRIILGDLGPKGGSYETTF